MRFPIVWIESLYEEGIQIQYLYNSVYNSEISIDFIFATLENFFENILRDFYETTNKNKMDNIICLASQKGIKLRNSSGYKIHNILLTILAQQKDETYGSNASIKIIKEEIIDIVNEIEKNLKNETDEQKRIQKDHLLNEKLDNIDIESKIISNIKLIFDVKINITFIIVIKYISSINPKNTKVENVTNFIKIAYDTVCKFSAVIPGISKDAFSSPRPDNEIYIDHPELIFYNILSPFFNTDGYYNSLNKMKLYLSLLPPLNGMSLFEIFRYINDNYFQFVPCIPFNDVPNAMHVTIDMFDDFFNSRGLIGKDKKAKDVCDFMKIYPDSANRNLFAKKLEIGNVKINIEDDQWNKIQYKQILLSDCNESFIEKCDVNEYPHPCIIYSHFISDNGGDPEVKIYKNELIPWIINFFVYGSFNKCKQPGKDSNYLNNIVDFIDLALKSDNDSTAMLSASKELPQFLYDLLFSELCKNKPKEKIKSFSYIDHLKDVPLLKELVTNHPEFENIVNDDSLPKEVNETEIELPNKNFNPFSDENSILIKLKFKEIPEIDEEIQSYESWKETHLDELGDNNIFDNVRSHLFNDSNDLDDKFGVWFLNSKIPLLTRQVYEICKAIKYDKNDQFEAEFKILCRLLNPWNDDDRSTKSFWLWFIGSLLRVSPFDNLNTLVSLLNDYDMNQIIKKCSPYYVYESNVKRHKGLIISKKPEVKTFFIERLLYSNTIFGPLRNKNDKGIYDQIFNFMSSLPFVKKTKNLYILAGFINEIMRVFRDQLNLLFLILNSSQKCTDLLSIEKFRDLIDDPSRTESRESLECALKAADEYNKGENAAEKLKSYINKLIEINNQTILIPEKKSPYELNYRLITKINVHSNMSLMNTFLPALAHLGIKDGIELSNIIPNAFKILTRNNQAKDLRNNEKYFDAIPSIFDFSKSFVTDVFIRINPIEEQNDVFGLPIDDLPMSLCEELESFLNNKANKSSYRTKIWMMIKNSPEVKERPNFSFIMDTLIPLFEEIDDEEKNEIDFASLRGVEAASYFLKSHKIEGKSIFEIIDKNSKVKKEDINFFISELKSKKKEEKDLDITSPRPNTDSKTDENYFIENDEEYEFHTKAVKVGEGATSITYKVVDTRTNKAMCKKVLKYNSEQTTIKDAQNALKEFEVMHSLSHPCICKAIGINLTEEVEVTTKEGNQEKVSTIALFLEYLNNSLSDFLKKEIDNTFKARIVLELVHAMKYLHNRGLIHRDLKIENIMLNDFHETKLVDFGLVRIAESVVDNFSFNEETMTKGVGTLSYMSPEMANEEDYDYKTDVYSFGIVLHVIFKGSIPKQRLKDKMAGKKIQLPSPSDSISKFCIELIERCLSYEPSDRPSFDEILEEMRANSYGLASAIDTNILSERDKELEFIENSK